MGSTPRGGRAAPTCGRQVGARVGTLALAARLVAQAGPGGEKKEQMQGWVQAGCRPGMPSECALCLCRPHLHQPCVELVRFHHPRGELVLQKVRPFLRLLHRQAQEKGCPSGRYFFL